MLCVLVACIAAILYSSYRITMLKESQRIDESVAKLSQDVTQGVLESRAELKTFSALHHDARTSGNRFNQSIARDVLRDNPAIRSLGHFERGDNSALPIRSIAPATGINNLLVGQDLNQYKSLPPVLMKAVFNAREAALAAPDNWYQTSDLVILQPGYQVGSIECGYFVPSQSGRSWQWWNRIVVQSPVWIASS